MTIDDIEREMLTELDRLESKIDELEKTVAQLKSDIEESLEQMKKLKGEV